MSRYSQQEDENNEESAMVYQPYSGSSSQIGLDYRNNMLLVAYNNQYEAKYSIEEESGVIPCYEVKEPIGYAVLLGCDRTPDDRRPLCVEQDLKLMEETLHGGGWTVNNPCLENPNPLTLASCNQFLKSLEDPSLNLGQYSCFMFYYSGHGISKGLLLSDGLCKPYGDIVTSLSSIYALRNKPKIFIYDSCRFENDLKKENQGIWGYIPFYKSIDKTHLQAKKNDYPPPHTVISFSACEGMPSFSDDDSGSFYTRDLCNKLKQLGELLSFCEVLTLVNGGTALLAQGAKQEQRPVMYSSLDRLLVLNRELQKLW